MEVETDHRKSNRTSCGTSDHIDNTCMCQAFKTDITVVIKYQSQFVDNQFITQCNSRTKMYKFIPIKLKY